MSTDEEDDFYTCVYVDLLVFCYSCDLNFSDIYENNPLFALPDRLFNVFSALVKKQIPSISIYTK